MRHISDWTANCMTDCCFAFFFLPLPFPSIHLIAEVMPQQLHFRAAQQPNKEPAQITYHTPFKCIGPIFTTCRVFSLFRIPSRRPRVMPATFNNFVPLIMWLSVTQPTLISDVHFQRASSNNASL